MIKKIIAALFIGCIATIMIMQNDPSIQQAVGRKFIQAFEQTGACHMQAKVGSLNIFKPSLELLDVIVAPRYGDAWGWKAKKMKVGFSWLNFIGFRSIDLHLEFVGLDARSSGTQGNYAITEHLDGFLYSPPTAIPVFIKAAQIRNGSLELADSSAETVLNLRWHSDSKKMDRVFKSNVTLLDGSFTAHNHTYFSALNGTVSVDAYAAKETGSPEFLMHMHQSVDLAHCPDGMKTCTISGAWDRDHGSFSLKNGQETLQAESIIVTRTPEGLSVQGSVTAPVDYVWRMMHNKSPEASINGTVHVQGTALFDNGIKHAQGKILLTDAEYGTTSLGKEISVTFSKDAHEWQGMCSFLFKNGWHYEGNWHWHEQTHAGYFDIANTTQLQLPWLAHWQIQPHACSLHIDIDQDGHSNSVFSGTPAPRLKLIEGYEHMNLRGSYTIKAINTLQGDVVECLGTANIHNTLFDIKGTVNDARYAAQGTLKPIMHLDHLAITGSDGSEFMSLQSVRTADTHVLQGSSHVQLMRTLVKAFNGYDMQGDGHITMSITLEDMITIKMHLAKGTIRLPHTYNFINGFDAKIHIDRNRQRIEIEDMRCSLHRGSVQCNRAVAAFDGQGKIIFAHAPLLFKHCLFNFNTDLFAILSGRMLFSKKEHELPHVKGALIIENAHIKENIFSVSFQQKLLKLAGGTFAMQGADATCDVSIKTCTPVYIKTDFLEAHAKVDLHIDKGIRAPEISGVIDIKSGSMLFPYKPLHITRGTLYFVPQQPGDPIIEVVAKNKIKKYNITMMISGSISNPTIMLESAPPLTEEQIIALLLLGSHEESLNILMPALIMQNINNLIFDKEAPASQLNKYVAAMLKPLKNVHLVPSFTDQSGRGGLRGALEVDINDRWRALIQKNFNLTEDTRFELEYMVSDDISVKGFRDERRDLGGEVEVRWKF